MVGSIWVEKNGSCVKWNVWLKNKDVCVSVSGKMDGNKWYSPHSRIDMKMAERVKMITCWRGYGIWRFDGVACLLWPKSANYQNLEPSKLIVDVYYMDPPHHSSLPFSQQTPLHHFYHHSQHLSNFTSLFNCLGSQIILNHVVLF